jgi:DNA-binding PadR family transcriptional regulator
MFEHHHHPGARRHRRGEMRDTLRGELGRHLRGELRRNLRHGAGHEAFSFGDLFGPGRRGIVRRGEIRPLILGALEKKPMHGYEVIQELEAQSEGRWRPSAGSVYPTLQLLADEGLVTSEEVDGRRTYTLTDAGRSAASEAAKASPRGRWAADDADRDGEREPDVRRFIVDLASAAIHVHRVGSPAAKREVARILGDARRQVYRLLSEDEPADTGTEPGAAPAG